MLSKIPYKSTTTGWPRNTHLEIAIKVRVGQEKGSMAIFRKMKGFVLDNMPEKIP